LGFEVSLHLAELVKENREISGPQVPRSLLVFPQYTYKAVLPHTSKAQAAFLGQTASH
jgi:hypothetical protein